MKESVITVIVPTYNRAPVLRLCLEALEAQTLREFDVIVVNDGSTDTTANMLQEYAQSTPLRLRIYSQENAGPARGRNLAISHAVTPLSVLIGDDILAAPTFLKEHVNFHRTHPDDTEFALGWTQWDTVHQQVTPFMEWYEKIQFDYVSLLRGMAPTWQHAYTSNLSFKTSWLLQNPFDERFRKAAWEDIELAFRLKQLDRLRLTFLQEAVATHIHPTTFLQAARRMETLGRMEWLFHTMHPMARRQASPNISARVCSTLGSHPALLAFTTSIVNRLPSVGKLHSMVLRAHHQKTYLQAQQAGVGSAAQQGL